MNVEIGTEASQFPRKELHKWDFPGSVYLYEHNTPWFSLTFCKDRKTFIILTSLKVQLEKTCSI